MARDQGVILDEQTAGWMASGVVVTAASRDAAHLPSLASVLACQPEVGGARLRFVIGRSANEAFRRDLAAGGPLAIVFSEPTTFRTLQVKSGSAVAVAVDAGDAARIRAHADAERAELLATNNPESFVSSFLEVDAADVAAYECVIEEIYSQTPGPGAGAKVTA